MTVEPARHQHCPQSSESHNQIERNNGLLKRLPVIWKVVSERAGCMRPIRFSDIPALARWIGQSADQRRQYGLINEFEVSVSERKQNLDRLERMTLDGDEGGI